MAPPDDASNIRFDYKDRDVKFYFLHVGKTGGSAIRHALRPLAREDIVLCGHEVTLADIPDGDKAFVAIRHPIDRFVSGFYSRFRRGRPLFDNPWSEAESEGFAEFKTANALAETLWSDDLEEQLRARALVEASGHIRSFLKDWFGDIQTLTRLSGRISLIIHQPDLNTDFERVKRIIGAPDARLPSDPLHRHANSDHFDRTLSDRGIANLQRWYEEDIFFYGACLALREEMISQTSHDTGCDLQHRTPP